MKYHIISLNDERLHYKKVIEERVQLPRAEVKTYNAYEEDAVAFLAENGINLRPELWIPKKGEVGIWASIVLCWQWCLDNNEELVVFEDDAIPVEDFQGKFNLFHDNIRKVDWDFAALWVPENQKNDYYYCVKYDENGVPYQVPRPSQEFKINRDSIYEVEGLAPVARVYQGYGGVGLLFHPRGAAKFMEISRKFGIYTPIDCHFYLTAHRPVDNVEGYAPHPSFDMVTYDWDHPTTIQHSDRVEV